MRIRQVHGSWDNVVCGFFNINKPDILFLTGDRSEMLAAGLAAVPFEFLLHISTEEKQLKGPLMKYLGTV